MPLVAVAVGVATDGVAVAARLPAAATVAIFATLGC
jgi:hypothetical protein